jgi:pyruvate,water dikinase
MTSFIKSFQELTANDVAIAGGKGASLGEMTQAGIPVPPGFVILASAFEKFLTTTQLTKKIEKAVTNINPEDYHHVEKTATKIRRWILEKPIPEELAEAIIKAYKTLKSPYVAVRSSATAEDSTSAAWAGQLESYLNTTQKTLLENVKKCWASLFTPRAIIYRLTQKLAKKKISVAVVVQKMIQSEKSGIAFSVHPVTQDENEMIIEAGYGLGEAIVSGQITPDSYVIQKEPLTIKEKRISEQKKALYKGKNNNVWKQLGEKGKKQKISDKQLLKLAKILLAIEDHYGFPVDVEFAYEKNKYFIVQSRPITTLTV